MDLWPGSIHQSLQFFVSPLAWVDCFFDWCNLSTVSHRNSANKTNCYIHHNVAGQRSTMQSSISGLIKVQPDSLKKGFRERCSIMCLCGGELDWVNAQQHKQYSGFAPHSPPVAGDRSLPGQLQWEAAERGDPAALHWWGPSELRWHCEQKCSSAPSVSVLAGCPAYRSPGQGSLWENISTLQCNSTLSCRRVMFSLCEVCQEGLQDTGWGITN